MKRIIASFTVFIMLSAIFVAAALTAGAASYAHSREAAITGFNSFVIGNGIFIYTAEDEERTLDVKDYSFENCDLLIFDKEGILVEAGRDLVADGPQQSVVIPKGGFLVASKTSNLVSTVVKNSTEGILFPHSTMKVTHRAAASADRNTKKLKLNYDNKPEQNAKAEQFLFIGDGKTYFNGTPLKLKSLCSDAGVKIEITYFIEENASLSEYADENHERGQKLRQLLESRKFDRIVIQGSEENGNADDALGVIVPLIRQNGAVPCLYLPYTEYGSYSAEALVKFTENAYAEYSELCLKHDLVLIPSALGFVYCNNAQPDIPLYCDRGDLHSEFASYMTAVSWMKAIFDIAPASDRFVSDYPEGYGKVLTECALKAVSEEYVFSDNGKKSTRIIEGNEYSNIAIGMPYTTTGERYEHEKWQDISEDGSVLSKLTDGEYAVIGNDTAIGAVKGSSTSLIIDLGELMAVKQIETDLWGNTELNIPDPKDAYISFFISQDGEEYHPFGKASYSDNGGKPWVKGVFTSASEQLQGARYVKVMFNIAGDLRWVSEISVFGTDAESLPQEQSEEPSEEPSEESSEESSEEISEESSEEISEEDSETVSETESEEESVGSESNDSSEEESSSHGVSEQSRPKILSVIILIIASVVLIGIVAAYIISERLF